jgi:hypothetical protein
MLISGTAWAEERRLAIVIGNNRSIEKGVDSLQFADDDAMKYSHFFAFIADEVTLLTRLDRESEPLYDGVATTPPTRKSVLAALDGLVNRANELTAAGDDVVVYFLFSGHGNYDAEGRGYLHLEDGRLTTRDLFYHLIGRSEKFHLVLLVDACNAAFLVKSRGASDRRPAGQPTLELEKYGNVGVILSSSSIGEVKEWGRYLAGIFSHQVRSALSGVADVDQDGRITFQELASFVESANKGVENPALRLTPYIRPPLSRPDLALVDFERARFPVSVELGFEAETRLTIHDADMVRYADFRLGGDYPTRVVLPGTGAWFVAASDGSEWVIPAGWVGAAKLSSFEKRPASPLASRGMDQYFQERLFSHAYSPDFAREYLSGDYQKSLVFVRKTPQPWYRHGWAWASVGLGLALMGTGGGFVHLANEASDEAAAAKWADEREAANDRVSKYNHWSIASFVVGGAALVTGTALFIFHRPTKKKTVAPNVGSGARVVPTGLGAAVEGRF